MARQGLCGIVLALLSPAMLVAGTFPPGYDDLIRREDFNGVEALADEAIAHAEQDTVHPERLCLALDRRVRLTFFTSRSSQAVVERAIACRNNLPPSENNSMHIAWLNAHLAQAGQSDERRRSALLKDVPPQIEHYRQAMGTMDFVLAARALAWASYDSSDLESANRWTQTALDALQSQDFDSQVTRAKLLVRKCFWLGRLGRFPEAEVAGEQSLVLMKQTFGVQSASYADALFSLGQVQYFAQHFGAARNTLEQSITIARQLDSPLARGSLAASLDMWANLLRQSGEYEQARAALHEAIAINRSMFPSDFSRLASKLTNLGSLEMEAGSCAAAIALLREAIGLIEQHSGPNSIQLVVKFSVLGICELENGDTAAARVDVSRELQIATQTYGKNNAHMAGPMLDMARVEIADRNFHAASAILEQAIGTLPADLDTLTEMRVAIERSRARAAHGENKDDEAFDYAVAAETARQRLLRRFAGVLDETTGLGLHSTLQGGIDLVLELALERNSQGRAERAWQLQIGSRSLITHLVAARLKAARQSKNPQIHSLWEQWETANSAYASALRETKTDQPASADLLKLRDQLESAERALAAHIPGLHEASDSDLASIRRTLPAHSALIAFASGYADAWTKEHLHWVNEEPHRMFAFKLAAGGAPELIDLGDGETLAASVRQWVSTMRDPASATTTVDRLGEEVRRRIWDPLRLPTDAQQLFIVPDGELHRVAWLALPLHNGPLVDSGSVPHILDSERELLAAERSAPEQGVTLIGAIPENESRECGTRLPALPGARQELDAIRALHGGDAGNARIFYLTGMDATKSAVLADMQKSSIVHFATHAFSGERDCANAPLASRSLGMAIAQKPSSQSTVAQLVLAPNSGADKTNEMLTASDIVELRLDKVNLVTLAACDTGLGPVLRDEGVFGLTRAFRLAGAHDVVMSLWDVNDISTADLMTRMYKAYWHDHLDAANALADAARDTLRARRDAGLSVHPYYWAAFLANGGDAR